MSLLLTTVFHSKWAAILLAQYKIYALQFERKYDGESGKKEDQMQEAYLVSHDFLVGGR